MFNFCKYAYINATFTNVRTHYFLNFQRIRHYIEWSSECIEFHILKEVHSGFLECFLNQPLDDTSGMYYCNAERGKLINSHFPQI